MNVIQAFWGEGNVIYSIINDVNLVGDSFNSFSIVS